MTKKELKKLAKELARLERVIKTTEDSEVRYRAEQEIMTLTNKVEDLEDMVMIDEMVMTLLEQEI
jgi:protein subunit release factor A